MRSTPLKIGLLAFAAAVTLAVGPCQSKGHCDYSVDSTSATATCRADTGVVTPPDTVPTDTGVVTPPDTVPTPSVDTMPTARVSAQCADLTCAFDFTGSIGDNILIRFGDGKSIDGVNTTIILTHTYGAAGSYPVMVVAVDRTRGIKDTASLSVTVTMPEDTGSVPTPPDTGGTSPPPPPQTGGLPPGCSVPPGLTVVTNQLWADGVPPNSYGGHKDSQGWNLTVFNSVQGTNDSQATHLHMVKDATAPFNNSSIIEGWWPKGLHGGTGSFHINYVWPHPSNEVYYCAWAWLDPMFMDSVVWIDTTKTGTDTLIYNGKPLVGDTITRPLVGTKWTFTRNTSESVSGCYAGCSSDFYANLARGGAGMYMDPAGVIIQGPKATQYGAFNFGYHQTKWQWRVHRGEWHRFEYFYKGNTPGLKNGQLRFWIDGTLITSADTVQFYQQGAPANTMMRFTDITNIYGGAPQPSINPRTQYIRMANWLVAIK